MTKVLLIGNAFDDKWLGSLVRHTKASDSSICIDILNSTNAVPGNVPYENLCGNIFWKKRYFPTSLYRIPKIGGVLNILDTIIVFKSIVAKSLNSNERYDVIDLSYILSEYLYCMKDMKRISNVIMLTPWGSDVLRVNRRQLNKMSKMVRIANFVCCGKELVRFKNDIVRLLGVPMEKFVDLKFGTEMIDVLSSNASISRVEAKKILGLADKYLIVCGYNGSSAQNHLNIIEAISMMREKLPDNILLLLPMTYGAENAYVDMLEDTMTKMNLSYRILRKYLSNEDLLYVRKAADIFIHAQKTDANSGTMAEYLLCKTKIVNAAWLTYPQREKYGVPYYVFESFDNLGDTIVKAYMSTKCIIDNRLIEDIKQDGWSFIGRKWANFYNSCAK